MPVMAGRLTLVYRQCQVHLSGVLIFSTSATITKHMVIPVCRRSGGTPIGARTTTTPAGKTDAKKDIDAIIAAHDPPYMATACSSYPQDIFKKVQKALSFRGPTFIHILAPCPPGWRYPTEKSVEMGKLAVKSGMWVLYEREYGKLSINPQSKAAMKNPIPLEEYLAPQGRFKGIDAKTVDLLKQNLAKKIKKLAAEEAEP